jgi:hypothetical protein
VRCPRRVFGTTLGPHVMRGGERPARLYTSCADPVGPQTARDLRKCVSAIYWGSSGFKRIWSLAGCGLPGGRHSCPNDDSADDRDDSAPLNYVPYSPKMHVSFLVTASASSWQCGGQGFESP